MFGANYDRVSDAICLLSEFEKGLPLDHPDRRGVVRSLEVLRSYGDQDRANAHPLLTEADAIRYYEKWNRIEFLKHVSELPDHGVGIYETAPGPTDQYILVRRKALS
jgi:hypothetical protein